MMMGRRKDNLWLKNLKRRKSEINAGLLTSGSMVVLNVFSIENSNTWQSGIVGGLLIQNMYHTMIRHFSSHLIITVIFNYTRTGFSCLLKSVPGMEWLRSSEAAYHAPVIIKEWLLLPSLPEHTWSVAKIQDITKTIFRVVVLCLPPVRVPEREYLDGVQCSELMSTF